MQFLKEITLYKNHGAKTGYWTARAEGDAERAQLVLIYAKTLDGKSVTKLDPVIGKNIGRSNETSPNQQAMLELQGRVNKQLDKGYVRTMEEAAAPATNAMGLEKPMLAQPIDKVKPESIDWTTAWAQPKLDGHRCLFKGGALYSRNGKPIALPHVVEAVEALGMQGLHLDGELYIHGMLLQDIGSLVKKPRAESLQLQYHVYDVVMDAPFEERMGVLEQQEVSFGAVVLVPNFGCSSRAELDDQHAMFIAAGYEGTILRHGPLPYQTDKRSSSLLKVKIMDDSEFTVIGFEEGTPYSQFEGGVFSETFRVPVWICSNPTGLTEATKTFNVTAQGDMRQKHAQWEMRHTYLDRSLTVQHFGHSKDGSPLLPVALRWREDL